MTALLAGEASRRFVVEALRTRINQRRLILISLPAPWLPIESLWAALPAEPAVLWDPPKATGASDSQVGIGEVTASELSPWTSSLSSGVRCPVDRLAFPGQEPPVLCWLGGLPFSAANQTPPWTDFATQTLRLPRWRYARGSSSASLHLAVYAPTDKMIAQVESELLALGTSSLAPAARTTAAPMVVRHQSLPLPLWQQWLTRILQAIDDGLVEKVVAARRSMVVFAQPIDVLSVLCRLRTQAPQSFRFALRRGASTFLGATPERLLRKHQRAVATDALAGTLIRSAAPLSELSAQLLSSDKDRREHQLVVRAITERLIPLCRLDEPVLSVPQVRALPHMLHLHTPIKASTRLPSTHIMELVTTLHPTPAVGGTPHEQALNLIAAYEPQARGHYAGPVGFYNEHGDGEFAVAIRSGVVIGDTAFVYGGAGIVRGSDPDREYEETGVKMGPMLSALAGTEVLP